MIIQLGLPLTFLLGFYVSLVVKRWWEQYNKLPWPDNIASYLRGLCISKDDKAKIIRRTIVRSETEFNEFKLLVQI